MAKLEIEIDFEALGEALAEHNFVEVIRCKDCKYSFDLSRGMLGCEYLDGKYPYSEDYAEFNPDDFCSRGERKDESTMSQLNSDEAINEVEKL